MKCIAILAASAIAIASAQQNCDSAKLISIVSGTNGAACTAETTYSPATLEIPTGDLLKAVCSNDKCKALLAEISAAVPTECLFGGKQLKSTIVDKFPGECDRALGTTSTPTSTSGAPSNTPGMTSGAPSNTPGMTSMAPSTTPDMTTMPAVTTPTVPSVPPASLTMAPGSMEGSSGSEGSEAGSGSSSDNSLSDGQGGGVPTPAPTTSGAAQLTAITGGVIAVAVAAIL